MNLLNVLVGLLMVVGHSSASLIRISDWDAFKLYYDKSYADEETELMRRKIFEENKKLIDTFNANQSESGYKLGINHLSDKTMEEIERSMGFRPPVEGDLLENSPEAERFLQNIYESDVPVPDELDWRKVPGRVTKVKNQLDCGSCWAHAAVGVLEGQETIRTNRTDLDPLSEQNIIDCARTNRTRGCTGGYSNDAYDYVKTNGIEDSSSYPYLGRDHICQFDKSKSIMSDRGYAVLPQDQQKLKEVVAKYGPVAVAINADLYFSSYSRGVFKDVICQTLMRDLNHEVLVVGYGIDPKEGDYWIIKNSWGEHWGEKGYIRFARNYFGNMCGITTSATIAIF